MNKPILVCVPWLKPHKKHLDDFTEWYALNKIKHNLILKREYYQATHKVQASALHVARELGCEYILFTEDDQWGYPVDALDVLLEADKDVIGFQTYFKDYPYYPMNCRKRCHTDTLLPYLAEGAPKPLLPFERGRGAEIQKTDLLTWAFTLVKVSVFDRLDEKGYRPFKQWGPHPTDSFFCEYCDRVGIDRYVHFGATICHGDVSSKDREYARRIYDEKHKEALNVVLRDDHGNEYGTMEYISDRREIENHFLTRGKDEDIVYDERLSRTGGDADMDAHLVAEYGG